MISLGAFLVAVQIDVDKDRFKRGVVAIYLEVAVACGSC